MTPLPRSLPAVGVYAISSSKLLFPQFTCHHSSRVACSTWSNSRLHSDRDPLQCCHLGKMTGRKLSLLHGSSPTPSLPQDHADFTGDPQVNFTSVCNSSSLRASDLPSTVQIVDLERQMTRQRRLETATRLLLYFASKASALVVSKSVKRQELLSIVDVLP